MSAVQPRKIGGESATLPSQQQQQQQQQQPTDSLKDQGNRAFTNGDYTRALDFFTQAIEAVEFGPDDEGEQGQAASARANATAASSTSTLPAGVPLSSLHLLYSNRSATYAALRRYQEALIDAERVVQLAPEWAKGHYRRGHALEGLLQFGEAAQAYRQGLALDPTDPTLQRSAAELDAMLKELKLTEEQLSAKVNPDADRFEKMVRWLKEGGAKFPRLYLQYYSEDYRGVHCLTRIPAEEIILYVPFHMILTSQVAMESEIGSKMVSATNQSDNPLELRSRHSYLAAFLLQEKEKGAQSYWDAYIGSLPQHYQNMPLFWSDSFLQKHLKGSMCLEKIADRIESLQAEYDNICEHVPEFKRFTHEQFVWARLAVITRIFGLMIRGNKTDGLVAYADMLNHKKPLAQSDCDTRWTFDDNLNGFTITATRSIPRGEQVYDSYGRKCNSRFFVNYGFALEDNEEDNEAVMRFAVPPDAPNLPLKTRLASTMPNSNISRSLLGVKEFQVPATYRETSDREKKTKEMFSFLRFIHANDQELLQMQHMAQANGQDGLRMDDIDPVSTRLEAEVLRHIQRAAQDALDAFDTSLEEDDALLRANDFPDMNVRNCVLMRRGEKQVLRWYTALAERAIPLLSMAWMDLRKQANKYLSNSPRDHYITHCVATLVKRGA